MSEANIKGRLHLRFREYRILAKLTQLEVAKQLDITQGAVSQWEKGAGFPRTELLPLIASLYGCTIDELLESEKEDSACCGNSCGCS